jgi:hypothetical protein
MTQVRSSGTPSVSSRASTPAPLDLARSPLFTPIPFLHRAAPGSNHRSLSRSPPPTSPRGPLPGDAPGGDATLTGVPAPVSDDSIPALGLVDELDDPRPGHLSDHPTALTSVTQIPEEPAASLNDRFVSAGPTQAASQGETPQEGGVVSSAPDAERLQPNAEEAGRYVRASTPEPSPTRVLAEETRERELAAATAAKPTEGGGDVGAKDKPTGGEAGTSGVKEEKDDADRMVVDEPDEDKENVPS